jgi:hypothetical protein
VYGDCDGYDSEPGGKTTIYEWSQSEINKWEKRLLAAGVKPEVYRTSKPKHCWVRFDTSLLSGIGWEGRGLNWEYNDKADILANGTQLNVKDVCFLSYARAHGNFNSAFELDRNFIRKASEAQKERDAPAIMLVFTDERKDAYIQTANALTVAGVSVIEAGKATHNDLPYIIADASNIPWFAYNQ